MRPFVFSGCFTTLFGGWPRAVAHPGFQIPGALIGVGLIAQPHKFLNRRGFFLHALVEPVDRESPAIPAKFS